MGWCDAPASRPLEQMPKTRFASGKISSLGLISEFPLAETLNLASNPLLHMPFLERNVRNIRTDFA